MILKDLATVAYHPLQEKMVQVLATKTQNADANDYFRVLAAFYLSQTATAMRAELITPHKGNLPLNMFAMILGESGMGKNFSQNIIEREILCYFRNKYQNEVFDEVAQATIDNAARIEAVRNGTDEGEERAVLQREYAECGHFLFSYDSGTGPAYKQLRTKCQIGGIGSMNFICDEIGSNLLNNDEILTTNLEAYDIGLIKQKLIKNSAENRRSKDRDAPVPSNVLMFGTPAKLFNGGVEEKTIMTYLETGYARRLFVAIGYKATSVASDAETLFNQLTSHSVSTDVKALQVHFANLASATQHGIGIVADKTVVLINLQYQLNCEALAAQLPEHETIRKAELQHRHSKALKLAGTYAFVDGMTYVTEDHMYAAIKLTEDSGICFNKLMDRDRPYMRLAKYICTAGRELTIADLNEDLPFFPSSKAQREDMLQMATAWGVKNHFLIKKSFDNSIEFYTGECLKETSLDEIILSYSQHEAYNYIPAKARWDRLGVVFNTAGYHWANHHFTNKHRHEDNVISGFNLITMDVDGGSTIAAVQELLKDYQYAIYTTKRHTPETNRFRLIIPSKYVLTLNESDYGCMMNSLADWLPFEVDATHQRCKKWLSNAGTLLTNQGQLLDPIKFIPKTAKNEEHAKAMQCLGNMSRIEAWFAQAMVDGKRNNTMVRYAFMLLDSGMPPSDVENHVIAFNDKFSNKLSADELKNTVLKSMWTRASKD